MSDKVLIQSFLQEFQAKIAFIKLGKNNIESWIMNKKDSAYVPLGEVELYVRKTDLDSARRILEKSDD